MYMIQAPYECTSCIEGIATIEYDNSKNKLLKGFLRHVFGFNQLHVTGWTSKVDRKCLLAKICLYYYYS